MNYFYFFFFLSLSALLWIKPLIFFICKKVNEAENLNILGALTFTLGISLIVFSINTDWQERLWILLTLILGILLCIRGLFVIFFLKQIKNILPVYLNHYYKFTTSISLMMLILAFFIVSTDYIGPQKNINECKSDNVISVICGFSNPEDIVVTPDNKFLLMSEFGGISPYGNTSAGDFALLRLADNKKIKPIITFDQNIWGDAACPQNNVFGPHGIDLVQREDGRYQFNVINHYPNETIEIFELIKTDDSRETWSLVWKGCINVPDKYYFNDVALKRNGTFYASHMYPRDIDMVKWLRTSLFKNDSGLVVKWDGNSFKEIPNSEGSGPNGISLDERSNILFISYNQGDKIVRFDLSINKIVNSFKVESPDNIFLHKNSAWITSLDFQPNDAGDCINKPACSLPFTIYEIDSETFEVFHENSFKKTVFGLPTIAVPIENKIFMGSFHSDRLGYYIRK